MADDLTPAKIDYLLACVARTIMRRPDGDPAIDTLIASTLGVDELPYTSNETDAQSLLSAGWSWIDATHCIRDSDALTLSSAMGRSDPASHASQPFSAPAALTRCYAALSARRTSVSISGAIA